MSLRLNSVSFFCLVAVAFSIGCGGAPDDRPELGEVSGTVTMDGEPLSGVSVVFSSNGQSSHGTTDADGKYELTYDGTSDGAVVGKHEVKIETVLDAPPAPNYKDPIPAKYNSKTELTADVKAGENPPIDFALTSK